MSATATPSTEVSDLTVTFTIAALDFEPPCDSLDENDNTCDSPAEWGVMLSCGHERLWCDFHYQRCLALNRDGGNFMCAICFDQGDKGARRVMFADHIRGKVHTH